MRVREGREVLRGESDHHAGEQADRDASEQTPVDVQQRRDDGDDEGSPKMERGSPCATVKSEATNSNSKSGHAPPHSAIVVHPGIVAVEGGQWQRTKGAGTTGHTSH